MVILDRKVMALIMDGFADMVRYMDLYAMSSILCGENAGILVYVFD